MRNSAGDGPDCKCTQCTAYDANSFFLLFAFFTGASCRLHKCRALQCMLATMIWCNTVCNVSVALLNMSSMDCSTLVFVHRRAAAWHHSSTVDIIAVVTVLTQCKALHACTHSTVAYRMGIAALQAGASSAHTVLHISLSGCKAYRGGA